MITSGSGLTLGGCHIGRTAALFLCLYIVLVSKSVVWAMDPAQLFEKHKVAVVKIQATGLLSNGKHSDPNAYVGSGFIIYSGKQHTVILTAAHVIGHKSEWDQENDKPRRKVRVEGLDKHGKLVEHAANARVYKQDDADDWAILMVDGEGYSCLNPGDPNSITQGDSGTLIGYESDSMIPGFNDGPVTNSSVVVYGFVLRFKMNVIKGQSGGPVLDKQGYVLGIASNNELDKRGHHIGVPISLLLQSLKPLLPDGAVGQCISTAPPVSSPVFQKKNRASIPDVLDGRWYGVFREYAKSADKERLDREQVYLTVAELQVTGKSFTPGREWTLSGFHKKYPKRDLRIIVLHYAEVDTNEVSIGSVVVEPIIRPRQVLESTITGALKWTRSRKHLPAYGGTSPRSPLEMDQGKMAESSIFPTDWSSGYEFSQ